MNILQVLGLQDLDLKDQDQDNLYNIRKQKYEYDYNNYVNLFKHELTNITEEECNLLLEYFKYGVYITNSRTFINIIQKTNNVDFIKMCEEIFQNIFNLIKNKDDIKLLKINNINNCELTNDQQDAALKIINFLLLEIKDNSIFTLLGYSGTGKSTVIIKLLFFLMSNNYISSIVLTAPTNKAVNVLKSKFQLEILDLLKIKVNNYQEIKNMTIDDQLLLLEKYNIKIKFLTIHSLLNYKSSFNANGERIFVKKQKAKNNLNYDIIIIDECSMLSKSISQDILNIKSKSKIICVGDNAQLPPVNEPTTIIFNNTNNTSILKQIVRTNNNKIISLSNSVRDWVLDIIQEPKIFKFKDNNIKIYKLDKINNQDKTKTEWFKKCVEKFTNQEDNQENNTSNIILTWTNHQCNTYNNNIRSHVFKKEKLKQFEIGDIIVLDDFYTIKDNNNKLYTSEQMKVINTESTTFTTGLFVEKLDEKLTKMKYYVGINTYYEKLIRSINTTINRCYKVWKLTVINLIDVYKKDIIPTNSTITVIKNESLRTLNDDKIKCVKLINKFRNNICMMFADDVEKINKNIIVPLWKEWNEKFVEPFASVKYGFSMSTHKSQGSTFYNVFVDVDDILNNLNADEAKRCVYTAITRTCNELYLLI